MAKILVFDNYDSFTYNLVHLLKNHEGHSLEVVLNDEIALEKVKKYDGIILSPGPGVPSEAGLLKPLIEMYKSSKRIFGVCLGQQAIAEVFGARLINLSSVYHGVATPVRFCEPRHYIFNGLPDTIEAGRYHSWTVDPVSLPDCLKIEAFDQNGHIMALSHSNLDVCSVQFHPESILTPAGKDIISNWMKGFN